MRFDYTFPDGYKVEWTGFNRCLCFACRELFGGVTGFERHRRDGGCVDPASAGLRKNDSGYWVRPKPQIQLGQLGSRPPVLADGSGVEGLATGMQG